MYRSHNCGELNASFVNTEVTRVGYKNPEIKDLCWVDLRDRYGITQLVFDEGAQIKQF
jgi:aspartyl-tRNA synthetase